MPINILPDDVASQIAAGEVVERPVSVVKELLENALDAGANHISIHIEQSGRSLIEVADDGAGIPSTELPLAVTRHATSKLRTADDLFRISTLGFRGEALASIGSIARLTVTSCQAGNSLGASLKVDGGRTGRVNPAGTPVGTNVRVEDLFFNVPARLKFLKSDATERQQIDGLVTRYALAYPAVRVELFHDNRPVLQTAGSGSRREVLAHLYGADTARQMLEISMAEEGLSLGGFISPISLTRSNRREINFFVNGRSVHDTALIQALVQAYHTLLMVGRYPLGVIFLKIAPEDVDVNVHPAKSEVRFRQPDRIFTVVQRAVRRALLAYSPVPQVSTIAWKSYPEQRAIDPAWQMTAGFPASPPQPSEHGAVPEQQEEIQPSGMLPILRLIGQVGATYLVAEGPDGLYLIDQHAAHERILFERYQGQLSGVVASQVLLQTVVVHLPPQSAHLLTGQLHSLSKLGFQVEPFGSSTFSVRAVPVFLSNGDPAAALRAVVEDFEEDESPLQTEGELRLAARICKRLAIKAGQTLVTEEQTALLRGLEACLSPRTCPHGRPTMIHLSVDLLERQFGRKGSR